MIIMGPAGLGKTTLAANSSSKIVDLDSGDYYPFKERFLEYIEDILKLDAENKIVLVSNALSVFYKLLDLKKKPLVFYYDPKIKEDILEKLLVRDKRKSAAYYVIKNQTEGRFNEYQEYDNAICIDTLDYDLMKILKERGIL